MYQGFFRIWFHEFYISLFSPEKSYYFIETIFQGGLGATIMDASTYGRRRGQPKADSCGQKRERVHQMWMSAFRKKKDSHFFIIIWKYSLSNINLIFEYSALDKTRYRHGCKVHLFLTTHKHTTDFLHILSAF